nr:restriction endonuclease subunit S [uncultured Psychroserpens sp.]
MSNVEDKLPEGWVETTLGEVSTRKQYGYTESANLEEIGPKFLRITDIQNDFINWETVPYCPITEDEFEKYKLEIGDVVIARTGNSTGATATIKEKVKAVFASYLIRFQINPKLADYNYIDFLVRSKIWYGFVKSVKSGSAQGGANANDFALFPVNLPTLTEQKAIAKVLTAFDDKIENLCAQNKTLEQTAQTIFKEWFGKYQIDDELPDGWRVGTLGEVIEFINGYAFKSKDLSKEPIENAYKVFKMGDIKKGGGFNPSKTKGYFPRASCGKLEKYILKNGDLLMSMTDMKDAISLLGHTALMIYDDEYIVNQRVGLIRADNDVNIDYPYLYLLTNNEDFIANLRAGANSGVQVNLSTQGIKDTAFIIADEKINKSFDDLVKPLFNKRKANSLMIKELTKTRDSLLPRLMRGEIRVNGFKNN